MLEIKKCFVVMGFGIKTDLATGRKLNLDKSYQALIKPVVEKNDYLCVRADEIKYAGAVEVPMYQELFSADLVIADLSTANLNAFYELGVRHALKPRTTILMSEELLQFPFDINHIKINKYTHLGDNIDYFEVMRFQKELDEIIKTVEKSDEIDSPVYRFVRNLKAPELESMLKNAHAVAAAHADIPVPDLVQQQTLSNIITEAEKALKNKDYILAKGLFQTALNLSENKQDPNVGVNDPYLIQRLALCTYKSSGHNEYTSALNAALKLLERIDLTRTNDPETVELAGSIEKHLYEVSGETQHIDKAIVFYQRGYFLLHNRHNGINLAYLLTLRATTDLDPTRDEKIADVIWANRIRRDVLGMCKKDSIRIAALENQPAPVSSPVSKEQESIINEQKFWIAVNKAEAHFGLGNLEEYAIATQEATKITYEKWMMESFTTQLSNLEVLLSKLKEMIQDT